MSKQSRGRGLVLAALMAALVLGIARPATASDTASILAVMMKTWDKPDAKLAVDPVVIAEGYAIAGWSQGDMGGRALLRKKADAWDVILCAGDDLKKPELLVKSGMTDGAAKRLAADLSNAEATLPKERLALFSKFEGLVMIDPVAGHPPHGHSSDGHSSHAPKH